MFKRTILLGTAIFVLAAGSALADTPVKGPFAGTVHSVGSITYLHGSHQTWNWDRGRITAIDHSSITLTRRDRAEVTFAITGSTQVRNNGASYELSDLKVGLAATVISQDGNAVLIRNIRGEGAPGGADQSAIEGPAARSVTGTIEALYVDGTTQRFVYDRGRITSIGDGSLTIKRADGETITFTYDDTTVVKDKHGAISVSDLKVRQGARFFSQDGALKLIRCTAPPHPARPAARSAEARPAADGR